MKQTPYIRFRSMGFSTEKQSMMTVLRGHTQFSIRVQIARVKGTEFGENLLQQIKLCQGYAIGRSGSLTDPVDQVYQHCLPLLERLAPQTSLQDLSLECFLHSPTYDLELVGGGTNEDIHIEGGDKCLYMPSFAISPMRTTDLPEACKATPRFQARRTCIAPTTDGKSLGSVQGRVMAAEGVSMYFKPRLEGRGPEFERELRILSRIKEGGLSARIRVPELQGIVVAGEGGETTMGMLMTLITSPETGIHLQSQSFHGKPELHKKWEEQVTAITHELHTNGIVWGDVNPMNVVIDKAMNAWVIDFGGMNNVEFVDDKNRETIEGDKQGIMRLFQEWLPSRSTPSGHDQ